MVPSVTKLRMPDAAKMCGRCYDEVDKLFPANCVGFGSNPEDLLGPIGMYHCPDCNAMVLAAIPHPPLCMRCRDRVHPAFDAVPTVSKNDKS